MNSAETAIAFSNGFFDKTYNYLANDATWEVVGENHFSGKDSIVQQCKAVDKYFNSVTTNFKTLHVIQESNKVVVSGTGEFIREGKRVSFIQACDVYIFNEQNQIQEITSYCIQSPL